MACKRSLVRAQLGPQKGELNSSPFFVKDTALNLVEQMFHVEHLQNKTMFHVEL